jgi:very-short-patch-repair endonuclease
VVGGRRRFLDVAWPEPMVLLEFDGYLPHIETRTVFDDDRLRQNDLIDAGWKVFRFTATMLGRNARREFAPVRRAVLTNESQIPFISERAV